jgi:hypothetical protein
LAKQAQSLIDRLARKVVDASCSRSFVCDTCREDPALARLAPAPALPLQDCMLVFASAGCLFVGRNPAS